MCRRGTPSPVRTCLAPHSITLSKPTCSATLLFYPGSMEIKKCPVLVGNHSWPSVISHKHRRADFRQSTAKAVGVVCEGPPNALSFPKKERRNLAPKIRAGFTVQARRHRSANGLGTKPAHFVCEEGTRIKNN